MFQYNESNMNYDLLFVKAWHGYCRIWKKNKIKMITGHVFMIEHNFFLQEVNMWTNIVLI